MSEAPLLFTALLATNNQSYPQLAQVSAGSLIFSSSLADNSEFNLYAGPQSVRARYKKLDNLPPSGGTKLSREWLSAFIVSISNRILENAE